MSSVKILRKLGRVVTSSGFLILIGVFVICLVVYFQSSKKKESPTRLNMRADSPPLSNFSEPVSLNVMFNYNGHSFDAYQTLGVPAGSHWDEVRAAFDASLASSDPSSKEFFLAAFNAIKKQQKF